MVRVSKDGSYVNNRNSAFNKIIADEDLNTSFFTKPVKKEEQVFNPFTVKVEAKPKKKDCFDSSVDNMTYNPYFYGMKRR